MGATKNTEQRFRGYLPLEFYVKADAPAGRKLRWGGVATTDHRDRQQETLLQHGLDFGPCVAHGKLNDQHGKSSGDVLGKVETAQFYAKGSKLPNGRVADANCHYVSGFFYNDPHSRKIFEKAVAAAEAGDPFGLSIEGLIKQRHYADNKIVTKAEVHHIAATPTPVNPHTTLEAIAKSMADFQAAIDHEEKDWERSLGELQPLVGQVDQSGLSELDLGLTTQITGTAYAHEANKAATVGHGAPGSASAGNAAALVPESLEAERKNADRPIEKSLSPREAVAIACTLYPHLRSGTAARLAEIAYAIASGRARAA